MTNLLLIQGDDLGVAIVWGRVDLHQCRNKRAACLNESIQRVSIMPIRIAQLGFMSTMGTNAAYDMYEICLRFKHDEGEG